MKKFLTIILSLLIVSSVLPSGIIASAQAAVDIVPTVGTLISEGVQYTEKGATYVYKSSSEAAYEAYTAALEDAGYTQYSENTIETNGASLNYTGANNRFSVYLKGDELVHVAYLSNKKLHITIQNEADTLPNLVAPEYQTVCEPSLIQMHIDENVTNVGMGYAFRLSDGSFIMIDGGDENADSYVQADKNYNLLREYQPDGTIKIAAWIFTHAHNDHINSFTSFIKKYSNQIEIGQLIYNFPSAVDTAASKTSMAEAIAEGGYIDRFYKAIAEYIPEAQVSTAYSGHKYLFADAQVEIYATPTDIFPVTCATSKDFNTSSLIFKVKIAGQEILFLGDSSDYALNVIYPCYGTALAADIVQMVHHGITYGKGEMYEAIGASVALWSAGMWNTFERTWEEEQNQALMRAPKTKEVILSYYGTRELSLPYTPPNTDKPIFTKPDGSRVEGLLEEILADADGDIFNEDLVPWAVTAPNAEGKYYRLSDGGVKISWITNNLTSTAKYVNNSEKSVYVYANAATLYATLPKLKANTKYQLSFDYMSQNNFTSATGTKRIFTTYGISAITEETPDISYNVFKSNVQTDCEGTEVYGTGNGWNHIETTFNTGNNFDAEFVLSLYATMPSTYKAYIDNIKLIEVIEPFSGDLFKDFEDYEKTNKEYYGAVSLVADSDDVENTLMQYDGTTAANTSSAQNRIILNPTSNDITLGTYYASGEKFNLSFKYKVTTDDDVTFYLRSGKNKTNASTISSYSTITYLSKTLSKASNGGWKNFTATYTVPTSVKIDGVSTTVDSSILAAEKSIIMLIGGSGTVLIDDVMIYRVADITVTGDSKYIEWSEDAFEYATAARYSPTKARVGDWYSFSLGGIVAEVTYGDEVLVPDEKGIYSFRVETGKVLNIPNLGTVKLNTSLNEDVTEDTIRVLGIGNSYTNDATAMLPEIAKAEGKDLRVGKAIIGGSSLQLHANNITNDANTYTFYYNDKGGIEYLKIESVTLKQALAATDWDYVTIQQASAQSSRDYDTYYAPYLETVVNAIKELAPNAEIIVHETWAYSEIKSQNFGVNTLGKESYSQIEMYEDLLANYKQLAADISELTGREETKIIPTGTAFRITRSQIHNSILNVDNNPGHANFLGRMIGAYAYYRTIMGQTPNRFDPTTSSLFVSSGYYLRYPTSLPYDHDGNSSTTKIEDKVILTTKQVEAYIPLCLEAVDSAFGYKESGKEIAIPDAAKTFKVENGGVSIRLASDTKGQALRFKSVVPSAERGKAYDDGYKLVEYGSLAIKTSYIGNEALVYNGKYGLNNKTPIKAVAYNIADNTDVIFNINDEEVVYTVAVINIAVEDYDMDITVRGYAVYKNETTGDEYYVYSDYVQTGSIFSVMEAIETTYEAYRADETSLPEGVDADKLKTDYDALITNATEKVKSAFASWKVKVNGKLLTE